MIWVVHLHMKRHRAPAQSSTPLSVNKVRSAWLQIHSYDSIGRIVCIYQGTLEGSKREVEALQEFGRNFLVRETGERSDHIFKI